MQPNKLPSGEYFLSPVSMANTVNTLSAATKAPWHIFGDYLWINGADGKTQVCDLDTDYNKDEMLPYDERQANALLIVNAPKMLQRLKDLVEELKAAKELMLDGTYDDSWMTTEDGWDSMINETEAVIKEAETP